MRKLNTLLSIVLTLALFTFGYAQEIKVHGSTVPGGSPNNSEALVTINYDGDNADAIGAGGTTYEGGARFTPALTGPLTGGELRYVQFYYYQAATGLTLRVYDAGTATAPGTLLLTQVLNIGSFTVPGWNEVELDTYIPITGNDLWVTLEVAHAAGTFPYGVDAGPANADGDWIYYNGVWQHLSGFALNYIWNIRGVVEDSPAPAALFFDNFDSYTAGNLVACSNPTFWTTWSNAPCGSEDGAVSSTYSFSSPNSAKISQNNDLVKDFGTAYTSGKYKISFQAYIPAGKAGYFNTLATFAGSNSDWGMECYFNTTAICSVFAGSTTAVTASYPQGSWFPVEVIVDLNTDQAQLNVNGSQVTTWQWTLGSNGSGAPLTLDANDFFGATANDEFYFDDYTVADLTVVPVELTSFVANVKNSAVTLNWITETELNNQGFEVQRRTESSDYSTVGSVAGNGTTSERQNYSFTDAGLQAGKYYYRLKQIDFNGSFEYSNEIFADINAPVEFALAQNYPNPFNPTTNITFSLAEPTFVKLVVYNLLGEAVQTLKNENMDAGSYNITFDASSLPSGMYLYKIETAQFNSVMKMMLMK